MTRGKLELAYISNDRNRKMASTKRRKGIAKKLGELTTLCGVEACAIIQNTISEQPTIWPSVNEAKGIIDKFRSLPENERGKWKIDQETFTLQRLKKMEEKLRNHQRDKRHCEFTQIVIRGLEGPLDKSPLQTVDDCVNLERVINQYIKEIDNKLEPFQDEGSCSNHLP